MLGVRCHGRRDSYEVTFRIARCRRPTSSFKIALAGAVGIFLLCLSLSYTTLWRNVNNGSRGHYRDLLPLLPLVSVASQAAQQRVTEMTTGTSGAGNQSRTTSANEAATTGAEQTNDENAVSSCSGFGPKDDTIVIDFNEVRRQSVDRLRDVKNWTAPKYEKYMLMPPGREHYRLLHYLTDRYGGNNSNHDEEEQKNCHVVDIGTRVVASALALGATQTPVRTFDLPRSRERLMAFRGKTEQEWQRQVRELGGGGMNITFYNVHLLRVPDEEFRHHLQYTWLILLDTHHYPYSNPFEREFLERLIHIGYKGLLLLDDIASTGFNGEMKRWWAEVQLENNTVRGKYKCYDLTAVGHYSGTGLLDFSGKVRVVRATTTTLPRRWAAGQQPIKT